MAQVAELGRRGMAGLKEETVEKIQRNADRAVPSPRSTLTSG